MIAADSLGGGKCGLCLDSQVAVFSSRVKERENFNKHEIQVLVSLTKPSPAVTFLYITCTSLLGALRTLLVSHLGSCSVPAALAAPHCPCLQVGLCTCSLCDSVSGLSVYLIILHTS